MALNPLGQAQVDIGATRKKVARLLDPGKVKSEGRRQIADARAQSDAMTTAAGLDALGRNSGEPAAQAVREIVARGPAAELTALDRGVKAAGDYASDIAGVEDAHYASLLSGLPALGRQFLEDLAAQLDDSSGGGGRRGGGGGGGGGGSGAEFPDAYWVNWWETGGPRGSLYDILGSQSENTPAAKQLVRDIAGREGGFTPAWYRRRKVTRQFGAPRETARGWFPGPKGRPAKEQALATFQARAVARPGNQRRQVIRVARELGLPKPRPFTKKERRKVLRKVGRG